MSTCQRQGSLETTTLHVFSWAKIKIKKELDESKTSSSCEL